MRPDSSFIGNDARVIRLMDQCPFILQISLELGGGDDEYAPVTRLFLVYSAISTGEERSAKRFSVSMTTNGCDTTLITDPPFCWETFLLGFPSFF